MKKKNITVRTVSKSNRKFVGGVKIDTSNTHILEAVYLLLFSIRYLYGNERLIIIQQSCRCLIHPKRIKCGLYILNIGKNIHPGCLSPVLFDFITQELWIKCQGYQRSLTSIDFNTFVGSNC